MHRVPFTHRRPWSTFRGLLKTGALVALLAAPAFGDDQSIAIDSFSTPQSTLVLTFPPSGTSASSSVSGAGILGGERDLQINLTSGIIAGNTMSATVSSGFFSYSQNATIAGNSQLQWDGTDGSATLDPAGLGGVDLTGAGSQDGFLLNFAFADLPVNVVIEVFTDGGHASSTTLALPGLLFSSTQFVLPYSSFTTTLGAGADFTNVGAIRMTMGSSTTAPDVVFNFFQTTGPVVTSDQAAVAVNEGQTAANTGTASDVDNDFVTLTASVGSVVNNGNGTWSWSFATSDGPIESQTVTITGEDDQGTVNTTSFALTVNNVAPTIGSVSNNGPVMAGSPATITVTATDPAGLNDPLTYSFDCDDNGTFEIGPQAANSAACTFASGGNHTVNVRVADDDGGVTVGSTVVNVLVLAPSCANATASPNLLWPPNHKFVAVKISGIVNPAPGAVTITVTSIFQDEPVQSAGSGNTSPDATGVGTANPAVRAERDGGNDGRVYHIAFMATGASGSCTGTVTVGVPKSQGNNGGPVDQGALYNSTLP